MGLLTQEQKSTFWRDGVIALENAVSTDEMADLRPEFAIWVNESRAYDNDYAKTLDGRPRFGLQPRHNADTPDLRRVQSPKEISGGIAGIMRNAATAYFCAELIGPSIWFHHGKVNSKLPSTLTRGEASGRGRCTPYEMALPAVPKGTSFFFAQQQGADAG